MAKKPARGAAKSDEAQQKEVESAPPDSPSDAKPAVNKAAAVRDALAQGLEELDDIDGFLKAKGITMPRPQISAYKAQAKAKAKKADGPAKRGRAAQPRAAKAGTSGAIPPDLFDDLTTLKALRDKYGEAEFKKLTGFIA